MIWSVSVRELYGLACNKEPCSCSLLSPPQ